MQGRAPGQSFAEAVADADARALLAHDLGKVQEWSADPVMQAHEPPTGSPMAADDTSWPHQPPSASLATCHAHALDHMRAVAALVDAGSWHPVATFSLTRNALIAAANAVYLNAPAAARDRQARGLAYAGELLTQRERYNREMGTYPGVEWRRLAFVAGHLALRKRGIEVARQRMGLSPRETRLPSTTRIIRDTARIVMRDPELQGHVLSHWMVSSSDAHALHWGALVRAAERGSATDVLPPPGLQRVAIQGDVRSTALYAHMSALYLSWSIRRTRELLEVGRDPEQPSDVPAFTGTP